MSKAIDEFICPKCGNNDCYPYDTDEINFLLMALDTIILIVIAKTAIEVLNNATNLNMKSLKNGVDINAFVA